MPASSLERYLCDMLAPMSRRLHLSPEARTTMRHLLHQMRTPIGQILGYSEMLEEEARERGQDDFVPDLEKIRNAANKLLSFVTDTFEPASDPPASPKTTDSAATAAAPAVAQTTPRPGTRIAPPSGAPVPEPALGSILVVDDEPDNRDLLSRRLERAGHKVATAGEGREALHLIEANDFDLILLDVMMPGMNGFQVLDAIRSSRSFYDLPVIMATALGGSHDTVEALQRGANDYVTKPFDFPVVLARVRTQLALKHAAREITELIQQLETRNTFIRRTFGRYVSDEVVSAVLETPGGLEIRGEKRRITTMMSDVRGFTALTESLTAQQIVSLLNIYLGRMSDVIQLHGGTIEEFIGDGIIAFFGAPITYDDDAARSVAAALAMQLAMEGVNQQNRKSGLPEIEMGIGIATGEAIVGNIGSERRAMYGAIGSTVNLAARIETYTLGGEIYIDDETRNEIGDILKMDRVQEVHPKGFDEPINIHRVIGIGGRYDLALPDQEEVLTDLARALSVRFAVVKGKSVGGSSRTGDILAVSRRNARLRSSGPLLESSNLRVEILDEAGEPIAGAFYAKVVEGAEAEETGLLRFTGRSPALSAALDEALGETSSE